MFDIPFSLVPCEQHTTHFPSSNLCFFHFIIQYHFMNLTTDRIFGQCTTKYFQSRTFLSQLWNGESNLVKVSTSQWCPITQFSLNGQLSYIIEGSWRCPILYVSMGHFLRPGICPIHFATTELDNSWEPAKRWIDDCFCSPTCIHMAEQEEDGGHLLKLKSV